MEDFDEKGGGRSNARERGGMNSLRVRTAKCAVCSSLYIFFLFTNWNKMAATGDPDASEWFPFFVLLLCFGLLFSMCEWRETLSWDTADKDHLYFDRETEGYLLWPPRQKRPKKERKSRRRWENSKMSWRHRTRWEKKKKGGRVVFYFIIIIFYFGYTWPIGMDVLRSFLLASMRMGTPALLRFFTISGCWIISCSSLDATAIRMVSLLSITKTTPWQSA